MSDIVKLIPGKKDKAKHLETLVCELGLSETTIKSMIKDARREGVPIMSSKCGYWLADSKSEQSQFIDRLNKQAYARLKTARELNRNSQLKND